MKISIETIRKDFPMFAKTASKPFVYLDSASSSQTPRQVLESMNAFYSECRANVNRGMYKASEDATERYEAARAKVAAFIGANIEEIIFTRGTTESLNLLAYSLGGHLVEGDEVVISAMEHHANLVPWQQIAKHRGFTLKFIPMKPDMTLDMDAAVALITPATKIVSVMYASNVLGTVNPIKELAALAHAQRAIFIVDAAQVAGHREINVQDLGCDFLAFSGHKMYGPTGIGVLYGKKEYLEKMDPFLFGGDMIVEVSREESVWNEVPYKFEAGTPNIAGAIGLGAAIDYVQGIGLENIREHEEELTAYAVQTLSAISGLTLYGPPAGHDHVGVVSFNIEGIHPHDLSTLFDRKGVCVRGGHHCAMPLMRDLGINGSIRASFGLTAMREDIDTLVSVIEKAKKVFSL